MKSYEQELSEVLAMMAATLKGASSDRASLAQAWCMVLRPCIDQQWLVQTCSWFLNNATFFPTPAEFINRARDIAERTEIQARLEATRLEAKQEDETRILKLQARFPGIDVQEIREVFRQTARDVTEKMLGPVDKGRRALPQRDPSEFVDPEQEARVRKQVEELRG